MLVWLKGTTGDRNKYFTCVSGYMLQLRENCFIFM